MKTRRIPLILPALALLLLSAACRSAAPPEQATLPAWDLSSAEFLSWQADVPEFNQDHAVEASGMAAEENTLWIASEKYARLLRLDTRTLRVRAEALDLPPYAEIEGVTIDGRHELLMSDEAHAGVLVLGRDGNVHPLDLESLGLSGSKDGLEGIAAANDGTGRIFLLLERVHEVDGHCVSRIFTLRRNGHTLRRAAADLEIPLEDCNWRLTSLEFFRGHLLALKTRFPGPRYELVSIDTGSGKLRRLLDLDKVIRKAEAAGFHGNIEGFALTADGDLWIVSDNAMTGRRVSPLPPPAHRRTLLLKIPVLPAPGGEE